MREDRESLRRPLSPWNHSAPVEQQDHNQQLPAANKSVMVDTQKKGRTEEEGKKENTGFFQIRADKRIWAGDKILNCLLLNTHPAGSSATERCFNYMHKSPN